MNDCFWCLICCEGRNYKCKNYLSMNSDEGEAIMNEYQAEIDKAVQPVRDKFTERRI